MRQISSIPMGWFRPKQAGRYAGDVCERVVRQWMSKGLPHVKVGGVSLINRERLDDWLAAHIPDNCDLDQIVSSVVEQVTKK